MISTFTICIDSIPYLTDCANKFVSEYSNIKSFENNNNNKG